VLDRILRRLESAIAGRVKTWRYVDTGPLSDRATATQAGLGWIGRNAMLIDEELGSCTFIGMLLTSLGAFGCDICQEVCPWNRAPAPAHPAFAPREEYRATPVSDLLRFSQADFSALFRKSAIKRAKLEGMKRNVERLTC